MSFKLGGRYYNSPRAVESLAICSRFTVEDGVEANRPEAHDDVHEAGEGKVSFAQEGAHQGQAEGACGLRICDAGHASSKGRSCARVRAVLAYLLPPPSMYPPQSHTRGISAKGANLRVQRNQRAEFWRQSHVIASVSGEVFR